MGLIDFQDSLTPLSPLEEPHEPLNLSDSRTLESQLLDSPVPGGLSTLTPQPISPTDSDAIATSPEVNSIPYHLSPDPVA